MPHGFCFAEALEKEGMTRLCSVLAHSQALQERRKELWGHLPIKAFPLSHLSAPGLSAWTSPSYISPFKKDSFVTVCDLQVLSLDEKGSSHVKSDINTFVFVCLFLCIWFLPLHTFALSWHIVHVPKFPCCTAPLHNGRPDFLVTCLVHSCVVLCPFYAVSL